MPRAWRAAAISSHDGSARPCPTTSPSRCCIPAPTSSGSGPTSRPRTSVSGTGSADRPLDRMRESAGAAQGAGRADQVDAGGPAPCPGGRIADRRLGSVRVEAPERSPSARRPAPCRSWARLPSEDLPRYYAAGDVFAMPCRTRMAGLEVEGWGNVFIEAAACGRPSWSATPAVRARRWSTGRPASSWTART